MGLLTLVEFHVTALIKNELPAGFHFHNLQHTRDVVAAVGDIAEYEDLNTGEWEDLMIAGWFHDLGFITSLEAHEKRSIFMARAFLEPLLSDPYRIERISNLIAVTQLGFCPKSIAESIIKDADTYHLSKPNYQDYLFKLRAEWLAVLDKDYSDDAWLRLNLDFLSRHSYYTQYGKKVLEKRKMGNIRILEFQHIDSVLIDS